VLLGRIAPLEESQPGDLTIDGLMKRLEAGTIREVIMGTNPTVDGDGTALPPMRHAQRLCSAEYTAPTNRIAVYYEYDEPFGIAECVYCFPVDRPIMLVSGNVIFAEWLKAGMQFRMEKGAVGTVTVVEPPKLYEPPSRVPDEYGRYARRVLGAFPAAAKRTAAAISSERDGVGGVLAVFGTSSPLRR